MPGFPIHQFSIISIRPNWGSAIFKATSEWFIHKLHEELQEKLGSDAGY